MSRSGDAYFDRQEVRDPQQRETSMFHALPGLLRHAIDNAPLFAERLSSIDPSAIRTREALAQLPLLRKSDLLEMQRRRTPFGGLTATPQDRLAHVYASPGPIYDPEGVRADYWRFGRALFAAGVRRGDLIHNTFSYHMTPAGMMIDSGARVLGCPVFPAGTGQTELQLGAIQDLQPTVYTGTPSFLRILLDRAEELGRPIDCFRCASVAGEAVPKDLRSLLARIGATVRQCYGTADVGLIAYETESEDGLVVDESVLLEIVRPGTGEPVPAGDVGEVVVSVFNPDYPLIRFATGDLSKLLQGPSGCGRTNLRLAGWMGRADQTVKVRGMFVRPEQIGEIVSRFEAIGKARLVVDQLDGADRMRLMCEVERAEDGLAQKVEDAVRAATGMRASVECVAPDSLANDGKVIEDLRPIDG